MIETFNSGIELINHVGTIHWRFASAMFLQTAVLVAVLYVLERCLRRRVRPVVRYWIWSLVLLKLMLPVTLHTPASVAYWLVREPAIVTEASPASVVDERPPLPSNSVDVTPEPLQSSSERPKIEFRPATSPVRGGQAAELDSEPAAVAVTAPPKLAALNGSGWLFIAWCGIAVLLGVIVVRRATKVWQLGRRATEAPRQLGDPLQVACELLDLSARRIRLRVSDEVGCPAICGFWRPTILIPRRLINLLDDEQFQLVFAHELSHWKRWDLQMNLLQTVLQITYFYNPAVWFANAVLRRLREEAVDDAVLIAAGAPQERYSDTLLDVAAQSLRPVEVSVRLIGILESRKALVQRIRRMATGTIPRSARLGLWGFLAVTVAAIALLPMAGRRPSFAVEPIVPPANAAQETSTPASRGPADRPAKRPLAVAQAKPEAHPGELVHLSGRITDENGSAVADARVEIFRKGGGRVYSAKANADGSYTFKRVEGAGVYEISVFSSRCLGLTDRDDNRVAVLDPAKPATRDFVLKLACQVRVQVVDEQGRPIRNVWFYKPGRYDGQNFRTDKKGQVTIGGLSPSPTVSRFAAYHKDFAIAPLDVKLDDPKSVVERKLTLTKGVAVRGVVTCSDGKPASGWTTLALPSWWNFMASPNGEPIHDDGSVEFPHVGPGAYKISVSIPQGGGMSVAPVVLSDIELATRKEALKIKVDFPSPASLGFIEGRIRFAGGRPQRGFWIHAFSSETRFGGGQYVQPGESALKLGPMPAGLYRLQVDSQEIEFKDRPAVPTGTKDVVLELKVRGPLALKGVLTVEEGHPLKNLRIRLLKVRSLRGPNYTPNRNWRSVDDPKGRFTVDIPGPGVYVVEASADGCAIARSEPVNSDLQLQQELRLKL
jgi:beta-lactamase regulating signal transducer with metallopeptidase domain/protocatechuate 3,4-dioxygenase beta subunit